MDYCWNLQSMYHPISLLETSDKWSNLWQQRCVRRQKRWHAWQAAIIRKCVDLHDGALCSSLEE